MNSALIILWLIWFAILAILILGLVTGKMLSHGSKGGGWGIGHLADRRTEPRIFWTHAILYSAICLYLFIGTDGFTYIDGISAFVGRATPIQ